MDINQIIYTDLNPFEIGYQPTDLRWINAVEEAKTYIINLKTVNGLSNTKSFESDMKTRKEKRKIQNVGFYFIY